MSDAKDEKLTVMLTSTDALMLKAMAKAQDASASEVVRKLIRQEYARRGIGNDMHSEATKAVQRIMQGIADEHLTFLARFPSAEGRPPSHETLDAYLERLKEVCERSSIQRRPGQVGDRMARYRAAVTRAVAQYPDTSRLQAAYDELAFMVDDWVDDLKAADVRGQKVKV